MYRWKEKNRLINKDDCFQCSPTTVPMSPAGSGARRAPEEGISGYPPSPTCSSITRPAPHASAPARVRLRSAASRTTTWTANVRRWIDFIHITQFQLYVTSSIFIYTFTFRTDNLIRLGEPNQASRNNNTYLIFIFMERYIRNVLKAV